MTNKPTDRGSWAWVGAQFHRLKPGSRLVAHTFPIPGMRPDRVVTVTDREDGVERKLYRYTVPLRKQE